MAASRRIDRGYHNLSKTISFRPFSRLTFPWTDTIVVLHDAAYSDSEYVAHFKVPCGQNDVKCFILGNF